MRTIHFRRSLAPDPLNYSPLWIIPFNPCIFLHLSRIMSLLDLPAEIWTSYVVPLAELSSMVRLAGVSKSSRDLAHHALQRLPSIVILAPGDLQSCLIWMRNRSICIDQLMIDRDHHYALETMKRPEFGTCFREIALNFSKASSDITGVYDNEMLSLLHARLVVLEIEAPEVVPATVMQNCLCCRNLYSITYTMKWRFQACDQAWLIKMIRGNLGLRTLNIGQSFCFADDVFAAIAERNDTLTDITMCVGGARDAGRNEHDQLRRLLASCPSLRKLTFGTGGGASGYGDGLVGMEGKCPHLEELIFYSVKFSGDSVPDFILTCPKLRVCHARDGFIETSDLQRWQRRGLPKLHDFGPYWVVRQLEAVVACATVLAEVRTYHMHCGNEWQTAAEALAFMPHLHTICLYSHSVLLLPYLPRYCPQLRVLKLLLDEKPKYCREICEALMAALPSLSKLEELQWRLSSGLGETELMTLAQHCPNLRSLDCESIDVTDAGLATLVGECLALRALRLWRCREGCVTDAFLHAVAQHCPYLEELGLPAWGWRDPPFSHAALTEVISACTHLRVLQTPQMKDGAQASTLVVPAGRLRRLTVSVM